MHAAVILRIRMQLMLCDKRKQRSILQLREKRTSYQISSGRFWKSNLLVTFSDVSKKKMLLHWSNWMAQVLLLDLKCNFYDGACWRAVDRNAWLLVAHKIISSHANYGVRELPLPTVKWMPVTNCQYDSHVPVE
ncbi:hypothetical protein D918_08186 [Trichuris suis]|nr:hypothetical protein D918_08186 [Trichuris suis]